MDKLGCAFTIIILCIVLLSAITPKINQDVALQQVETPAGTTNVHFGAKLDNIEAYPAQVNGKDALVICKLNDRNTACTVYANWPTQIPTPELH